MGSTQIREADAADLPGLAALMGVRDGLAGPHPGAARALLGLDPTRIRAWVAVDGEEIVAMTCMELHRLQLGSAVIDAGYWTNLYIREDYRDQLLYPRLPQAMLRGASKAGVSRVYLAIRRLDVAEGHLRIGFREVDRLLVRLKPMRPLSLLAKHFNVPTGIVRAAGVIDRVAGLPLRAPGWRPRRSLWGGTITRLSLPGDAVALAELLTTCRAARTTRRWDPESVIARFQPAADGEAYSLLGLRRDGVLIGATAVRITTREGGLRIGVLMELAARNDEPQVLARLLRAGERAVREREVDGVLALDALGAPVSRALREAGYLETKERYVLMVAPKRAIAEGDPILDASAWRFPLSDHDAF
jgi:N-acetylglutamate synthase-like GNAT family acetyltransferase